MKITILSSFFCPYEFAFEAVRSMGSQDIDTNIILLDDGSPVDADKSRFDRMATKVSATVIRNEEQGGEANARLQLVGAYLETSPEPDDIVIWFDGDDKFVAKDSARKLVEAFEQDTKFVFGMIQGPWPQNRYGEGFSHDQVRALPWGCSPPRCFRSSVLLESKLVPEMFQCDGKWLESATDQAIMYELIEQTRVERSHIKYVDDPIMIYRLHEGGTLGSQESHRKCMENEKVIRSKLVDFYAK